MHLRKFLEKFLNSVNILVIFLLLSCFVLFSVAANVLKQDKLELEGYHLNLKPKHPGLAPSLDRKKLVGANIDSNLAEDGIFNTPGSRKKMKGWDI